MNLLRWLFGCTHSQTTWPQSKRGQQRFGRTHVTCLICGKEFHYSWSEMRVVTDREARKQSLEFETGR